MTRSHVCNCSDNILVKSRSTFQHQLRTQKHEISLQNKTRRYPALSFVTASIVSSGTSVPQKAFSSLYHNQCSHVSYPQILFGSLLVKDRVIVYVWQGLARRHSRYPDVLKLVGQLKKDRVQEVLVVLLQKKIGRVNLKSKTYFIPQGRDKRFRHFQFIFKCPCHKMNSRRCRRDVPCT